MLPTFDTTIDGDSYRTTALGAKKGRAVFLRFLKIIGAGAEGAASKISKGSWSSAIAGLAGMIERASEDDLEFLCAAFSPVTTVRVSGSSTEVRLSDVFEVHFAAKMRSMFAWLIWCLESNYADFFGEARKELETLFREMLEQASTEFQSTSRQASTGGSGDSSQATSSE